MPRSPLTSARRLSTASWLGVVAASACGIALAGCGQLVAEGEPSPAGAAMQSPPQPAAVITAPVTPAAAAVASAPAALEAPAAAAPQIRLEGQQVCSTGPTFYTEHGGLAYPTTPTDCDHGQMKLVITCPGGCLAAQGVRYAVTAMPVVVTGAGCDASTPRSMPGNINADSLTGTYFLHLPSHPTRQYESQNPGLCKTFGRTVIYGFMLRRVADGAVTPVYLQLTLPQA